MRKKPFLATILFSTLVISQLALVSFVNLGQAQPTRIITEIPKLKLLSPQSIIYSESNVALSFNCKQLDWGVLEYSNFKFWLDNTIIGNLDTTLKAGETYSLNLTKLSDGEHTVKVTGKVTVIRLLDYLVEVAWGGVADTSSGELNFTVDANAPSLSILTPQNKTFDAANIFLNFTSNELTTELFYSLDGNSNVTFTADAITHVYGKDNYFFALTNIEQGSHKLRIYAKDEAGHIGESNIYYFAVNLQPTQSPSPSNSPSPTTEPTSEPTMTPSPTSEVNPPQDYLLLIAVAVVAIVAVVVAVAVLLLGYIRRRRATVGL